MITTQPTDKERAEAAEAKLAEIVLRDFERIYSEIMADKTSSLSARFSKLFRGITMSHTKNEAREIALTLSPCDAKALIDGKRLLLRHANKPSLELRIGTPLGDAVADLVEKDVAPRGYKISSLDVGSHGRFWQAHLDVDHSLEDNSEAGAIAACHRHQNRIVRDAIHDLLEQIEDYVDPAGLRDVAQEIKKRLKL